MASASLSNSSSSRGAPLLSDLLRKKRTGPPGDEDCADRRFPPRRPRGLGVSVGGLLSSETSSVWLRLVFISRLSRSCFAAEGHRRGLQPFVVRRIPLQEARSDLFPNAYPE